MMHSEPYLQAQTETMAPTINCDIEACPLQTNPDMKFCPRCGSKTADKLAPIDPTCGNCKTTLNVEARFCHECGTATKPQLQPQPAYDSRPPFLCNGCKETMPPGSLSCPHCERPTTHMERYDYLVANHRPNSEITAGRGLTAGEMQSIESGMRKAGFKPDRQYQEDADPAAYMGASNHWTPEQALNDAVMPKGHGRTAIAAGEGQHRTGHLSHDGSKALPADYYRNVRVIPYRFQNAAQSGRQMVGPQTPGEGLPPEFRPDGSNSARTPGRRTKKVKLDLSKAKIGKAKANSDIDMSKLDPTDSAAKARAAKRRKASKTAAQAKGKKIDPAKKTCPACGGADLNSDDICLACGTRGR